jgi:hypothetical protein
MERGTAVAVPRSILDAVWLHTQTLNLIRPRRAPDLLNACRKLEAVQNMKRRMHTFNNSPTPVMVVIMLVPP